MRIISDIVACLMSFFGPVGVVVLGLCVFYGYKEFIKNDAKPRGRQLTEKDLEGVPPVLQAQMLNQQAGFNKLVNLNPVIVDMREQE